MGDTILLIGQRVDIPIRSLNGKYVADVGHGTMVGYTGKHAELLLVRWDDGVTVPYYPDQVAPPGRLKLDGVKTPWGIFANGWY